MLCCMSISLRNDCEIVFFVCKHKTSYDRRISDWSSDVCSSDLGGRSWGSTAGSMKRGSAIVPCTTKANSSCSRPAARRAASLSLTQAVMRRLRATCAARRSEEQTYELQALMRSSHAVFCLNDNNTEQAVGADQEVHTHLHKSSHNRRTDITM